MNPPLSRYLPALLITLAVELPLLVLILRRHVPVKRIVLAGLLASGFTHPQLWYLWPRFFDDYTTFVVTGELTVVALETVILALICRRHIGWLMALAAAALANAGSYSMGVMLRGLWD